MFQLQKFSDRPEICIIYTPYNEQKKDKNNQRSGLQILTKVLTIKTLTSHLSNQLTLIQFRHSFFTYFKTMHILQAGTWSLGVH